MVQNNTIGAFERLSCRAEYYRSTWEAVMVQQSTKGTLRRSNREAVLV